MNTRPCPRLEWPDLFSPGDALPGAGGASTLEMRQSWRAETEPGFSAAAVRFAWDGEALWVLAEMPDTEIVSPESRFNQPFFLSGDALEIFLKPADTEAYYEFHVGPLGQLMQLRIPSEADFRRRREAGKICPDYVVSHPFLDRKVWILPGEQKWSAAVRIPLAPLTEGRAPAPGDLWQLSFCRYDHFYDGREPVTSSTSAFTAHDFHRVQEWSRVVLG